MDKCKICGKGWFIHRADSVIHLAENHKKEIGFKTAKDILEIKRSLV